MDCFPTPLAWNRVSRPRTFIQAGLVPRIEWAFRPPGERHHNFCAEALSRDEAGDSLLPIAGSRAHLLVTDSPSLVPWHRPHEGRSESASVHAR
eukprot:scaffold470_cov257-Pinguiococcus_pyrenoidosus.AAC.19